MRIRVAAVVLAAVLCGFATSAGAGTRQDQVRELAARVGLARAILTDVNTVRARNGLRPVRPSVALGAAAKRHSFAMARKGFFAHESLDGSVFWKRIKRFYASADFKSWRVGETLLWASPDIEPAEAVQLWLRSPTHRTILLSPNWREIGLSAVHASSAPGAYGGREVTIVTADFGARTR